MNVAEPWIDACTRGDILVASSAATRRTWIVQVDRRPLRVIIAESEDRLDPAMAIEALRPIAAVCAATASEKWWNRLALLWTNSPAPFRLYHRKGLLASVTDRRLIVRRRFGRDHVKSIDAIERVETWVSGKGAYVGVSVLAGKQRLLVASRFNPDGLLTNLFDIAPYHALEASSTDWAFALGHRLAAELNVAWDWNDPYYHYAK